MSLLVEELFPGRKERLEEELHRVLAEDTAVPARLLEAMRHAVFSGGKRLRPLLCLAGAEAAGGTFSSAVAPAVAVELLHTYTLVHDDLPCMDDDDVRRGKPTVHVAFGEAMAVLAGDALQALAFEMLAATRMNENGRLAEMLRVFSRAAGPRGVVGGQVEDVGAGPRPEERLVEFVHRHKTADLFEASLRMGALAAGADDSSVERLGEYGSNLGIAFQIVDDILDADQLDADRAPELNCLLVLSLDEARALARRHTDMARRALTGLPGNVEPLDRLVANLLERGY